LLCFFFSSRRRHTRSKRDWSSDVCSSDLLVAATTLSAQRADAPKPAEPTRVVRGETMRPQIRGTHGIVAAGRHYSVAAGIQILRSEERRVGKEWRSRGGQEA